MELQGRRLADTRMTQFPLAREAMLPGDYWLVRDYHDQRLLNVKDFPEDRNFWGGQADPRYDGNLTGWVMGCFDPLMRYGLLSIHTVRVENDGTCSVRPDDGSSNSILIKRREDEPRFHGFIEHGLWHGGIEPGAVEPGTPVPGNPAD